MPEKLTTEVVTKPLPLTIKVKGALPTRIELEERELTVGAGLFTEKVWLLELPPPGEGFETINEVRPALPVRLPGIVTFN